MKNIAQLVGVPTVICLLAGLLLAWVHGVTEQPIREAKRKQKMAAIKKTLPAYDNQPDRTVYAVVAADGRTNALYYVASRNGAYVGAAREVTGRGYGGELRLMIGVNADGAVHGLEVLPGHKETPGLGAKIASDDFQGRFAGRSIRDTVWKVDKEDGAIQAITAATISSKAVTEAVAAGLAEYLEHEAAIRAAVGADAAAPQEERP
jgi:Na+-translocating ferredoxin:NAD+ oxidoreductase subunit G